MWKSEVPGTGRYQEDSKDPGRACCPHPSKVTCLEPAFGGRTKVPLHPRESQLQFHLSPNSWPLFSSYSFFLF